MSTETDSSGEERVLRLLDDEGARWRAGYQPPSFDDAVRRLALPGDEGARIDDPHEAPTPAVSHVGWWRPALIAAAVLVLVGGVVGVAVRAGVREGLPSDSVTSTTRLASPPGGFHVVEGTPAAGVLDATASPSSPDGDTVTVTYVGPRELPSGKHETLVLTVTKAPQGPLQLPSIPEADGVESGAGVLGLVRGHAATVKMGACAGVSGCQAVDVTWAESDDEGVTLSYAGPGGSLSGTLGFAEIMAAAESFDDRSGGTASPGATTRTAEAVLPRDVLLSGRRLQLWGTAPLQGAFLGGRTGGPMFVGTVTPAWGTGDITYCDPVDVPILTAQDADHVEVTVARYVTQVPAPSRFHSCPAVPPSQRLAPVQSVVLSDVLGPRQIIDGATKKMILPVYELSS